MNTERRKKTKRGVLVALLLLCFLAIIGSTYAKYTSSKAVGTSIDIAKWAVQLQDKDIASTDTINVVLTPESNTDVVANKIAPSVTAKGEIELDLTGTEVAVDVSAVADTTGLASITGFKSADKCTVTVKIGETSIVGDGTTISLADGKAFTSANGVKKIDVELTWTNESPANDADDTASGIAGGTISIPVTVTVAQHIAS